MGNCVRKDSNRKRSPASSPEKPLLSGDHYRETGKTTVAGNEDSGDRFSFSGGKRPMTEVKIKITKKQLELLDLKEMHGLTLEQVLTRLMNGGDEVFRSDERSWRPKLESIPE